MPVVPGYGPALADGLAQLLGNLTAAEATSQKARATVTACQRDVDAAIFGLQSVVAQGRAVLASFGVGVSGRSCVWGCAPRVAVSASRLCDAGDERLANFPAALE